MAGDWLKFEKSTSDKPEVWLIAEALSIDPDAAIGKLLRVWAWFDEQSEYGNAPSVSKLLLDRRVGVSGFCDAMINCGWMEISGDSIFLPNFSRHNGKTAKNRALTAKRVAEHKKKSSDKGNDDSVSVALPREEKRREEIKTKDKDLVPAKADTSKYSDEFESAWLARVKREGNDPKAGAYKCWKANLKRGVTPEAMTDGMARYKKFCEAKKSVGTEGVQMLQTFLGPNENYTQDWTVNQEVQANGKYNGSYGKGQQADYSGDGWAEGFDPTSDPFADLLDGHGPTNH
jgi:hypothetical protein